MLGLGQYGGVAASGVFQNRDLQDYEGFTGFGRCVASLGGLNMDGYGWCAPPCRYCL